MEKIIHSDKFVKFISLLVAIGLWFYVVYAENPQAEFWVRNIPVSFVNTDRLLENSLVVLNSNGEQPTISVKVKGRRRDVSLISASNISASVDLGDVFSEGTYSLPVNINFPIDGLEITDKKPYTLSVTVDRTIETTKNVTVRYQGSPAEHHSPGEAIVSPAIVRISGPASVVNKITSAVAIVDLNNVAEDFTTTVAVSLLGSDNNIYQGNSITLYNSGVDVTVPILLTKTVPIAPAVYNPTNMQIEKTTAIPETVEIKGTPSVINGIEQIDTLPVTLQKGESPITLPLTLIYPDGVSPANSETEFSVEFIIAGEQNQGENENDNQQQ